MKKDTKKITELGEFELIKRFRRRFTMTDEVYLGIGDDTAVLHRDKKTFDLITTDSVIEGRHFTKKTVEPYYVGWKAIARSVSDIAAMGGRPRAAVVALNCPKNTSVHYLSEIERGMAAAGKKFQCPIVGGDLAENDTIILTSTIMGDVAKKHLLTRAGAQPGDLIMCTGKLGGSLVRKHATFTPRLKEGAFLAETGYVTAMCDISDGLAQDLSHILEASHVGGQLYAVQIPLSAAVKTLYKSEPKRREHAMTDGEDYELLFTVKPKKVERLLIKWKQLGMKTPITVLGRITKTRGIALCNEDETIIPLAVKGFTHF